MTRPPSRTTFVPALAAVLLLGACTAKAVTAPPSAHTSAPVTDPAQLAQLDAAALLGGLVLPSGATKSAAEPSGTPPGLNSPAEQSQAPTAVTRTGWWVVDTNAETALSWIETHDAAGSTVGSLYPAPGLGYRAVSFDKPGTVVLASRRLLVTAAPLSGGRAVVRADAEEIYRPAKSSAEFVPDSTSIVVTITQRLIPNAPNPSPITITVTDRTKIAAIRALINSLPVAPDLAYSCPADTGAGYKMTFVNVGSVNTGSDVSLATVDIGIDNCGGVPVTIGGKSEPPLDPHVVTGQYGLSGRIGSILGVTLRP